MKTFPMFLKLEGREVVILGGGEQAAQKARLIARTEARIVIAAASLNAELAAMVASGKARHHAGPVTGAMLAGLPVVFAASGCAGADAAHAALAKSGNTLVNAVDAPAICDAFTPAIVDRDPVVVAIGTEGTAPVLARQVKTRIEGMLEPDLGRLAARAGELRDRVARLLPRDRHRAFWGWVFNGAPRRALAQGNTDTALSLLAAGITTPAMAGKSEGGHVSLVGAGPGAQDLITLRGVKRLQEADVILYDRLVSPEVLELARRDAERIFVGKAPGDACLPERWSQARINRLIVAEAAKSRRVVRLKSGDPGIFGRGDEEMAACRAAGISCEIVPGITAASGALAELGECQTVRGRIDRFTVITGTGRDHRVPASIDESLTPGTRLAIYMGTANAEAIVARLLRHVPAELPVTVCQSATQPDARSVRTTLRDLAACLKDSDIRPPAIIFIDYEKSAQGQGRRGVPAVAAL